MLTIQFHNDGTGFRDVNGEMPFGNYNVRAFVNHRMIWEGRLEHHARSTGWQGLVSALGYQVNPPSDSDNE